MIKLLDEKFEYHIEQVELPSYEKSVNLDFLSNEYSQIDVKRNYYKFLLNALGFVGWELVFKKDESFNGGLDKNTRIEITNLIFKRSSRSNHFGQAVDIDKHSIYKSAEKKRKKVEEHFKKD